MIPEVLLKAIPSAMTGTANSPETGRVRGCR
jgi:hypothetical protein